jgi:hypothetical protein
MEGKLLTAERGAVELAGGLVKGSRLARLGSFLLAAAMPGPWDVLFLYIGFFGELAAAKEKLRQEYWSLGFAEGVAAHLLGIPRDEASRMLLKPPSPPSVGEMVAGFEGVRERASATGAVEGWRFAGGLTTEQRGAFLEEGFATIAAKGYTVGPDFNLDDVIELAVALKPLIQDLLDLAEEQQLRLERMGSNLTTR